MQKQLALVGIMEGAEMLDSDKGTLQGVYYANNHIIRKFHAERNGCTFK